MDEDNTIKLPEIEPEPLGIIRYKCPYCDYENVIIQQPGPISLKLTCTKCNKQYEYQKSSLMDELEKKAGYKLRTGADIRAALNRYGIPDGEKD